MTSLVLMLRKFWTTVCKMSFKHEVGSIHNSHAISLYTLQHIFLKTLFSKYDLENQKKKFHSINKLFSQMLLDDC